MSNLVIPNTFSALSTITSAPHNANYSAIATWLNNRDNATDFWLNVKSGTVEATTLLKGKGTTTNDNATTLYIGEYISATYNASNFPSSTHWNDAANISLTAGDWDVTHQSLAAAAGSTCTAVAIGISTTTGDVAPSASGNGRFDNFGPTVASNSSMTVAAIRFSIASTTTVYAKFSAVYSAGNPTAAGIISARRIR